MKEKIEYLLSKGLTKSRISKEVGVVWLTVHKWATGKILCAHHNTMEKMDALIEKVNNEK